MVPWWKSLLPLLILLSVSHEPVCVHCDAPKNEYLAASVWPVAHHDLYAQASSPLWAITDGAAADVDILFDIKIAGPLTVLFTDDGFALWGTSYTNIFKIDRRGPRMRVIDVIPMDEGMVGDMFRGIYSFLSKDGNYYVCGGAIIATYANQEMGNSLSKIAPLGKFVFNEARLNENILAIAMTYDGFIVFLTNKGRVGILTRDLRCLVIVIDIQDNVRSSIEVSNSMAVDEFGGIYVVTSQSMHRLWWNADDRNIHTSPLHKKDAYHENQCKGGVWWCVSWTVPYDVENEPFTERPTKFGSGTTPSILTDAATGRYFVAIADGLRQQSVVIFDCASGDVVAQASVRFDPSGVVNALDGQQRNDTVHSDPTITAHRRPGRRRGHYDIEATPYKDGDSYTEQSLLIHKNRIVIVQNAFTATARAAMKRVNALLERYPADVTNQGLTAYAPLLPVALGDSPVGIRQFEFNMSRSFEDRLRTVWVNDEFGCPNSIPTMSVASGALYCVGKLRNIRHRTEYPVEDGFRGSWSIQALDWFTGDLLFSMRTGGDVRYNSLYAATQIGPDGEVFYGAIGGIVRLRPRGPTHLRQRMQQRRRARRVNN